MVSYPADWEEMRLSEFAEINPHTEIPEKFYYVDLESVKDIYIINARRETKYTAPSRARRYAKKGDVFFQTVRPYQRNNYIFKLDGDYVFSTGYAQLRTKDNPDFLFYLVRHDGFVNEVLENCTGTSYPAINPATLAKIHVHIPPLQEQTAIADTLAVFDRHITNLTELVAKKKAIRDGALDDLMSGRTRLEGFCGEWEVRRLGEIGKWESGSTPSRNKPAYYVNGNISWVKSGELNDDILTRTEEKITQKALDETAVKLQKPGAVIIAMYGATIGKLAILGIPATTNQACCVCEVFEGTYNKFLFYSLMYYREQMKTLSAGAAQPNISKQIITQYSIPLPTLQEQTAIADTLTALDTEISSLEAERLKISQIRDGAMNDLLTGKVRLTHGN